jgi:hypothetical protein
MGVRHLQDDEYLLRRQKIIGIENVDKEELENLYQAKANKKIPIINFALYVWIYHLGKHNFDSAKVERKIARINEKYDRKISKHPDNDLKQRKIEVKREKKAAEAAACAQ